MTRFSTPSYLSVALLIATLLGMASPAQAAPTTESHSSAEVDTNAPIAALTRLKSLQSPSQLSVNLPTIYHVTTDNGTPVALVQAHNLPMVDVSMYFNAGSARDEAIKPGGFGLASLTASMLDQGTQHQTQDQLAETIEQLGLQLGASAYRDMFTVNLRSLSDDKYLTPAVAIMRDIISQPTFPADNLARTKAQYLIGIQQAQEDPDSIATLAFNQALYGNHPYAHPVSGTLTSIPKITRDDLQAFAKRFLVAKNANIAITGDVSLQQAKHIANQLTASLPTGSPAPALPDAKVLTQAKRIHIPFDSTQTTVIMGQLGVKRSADPTLLQEHMNFAIANDIVGGSGFQARLMADIRKKRGLTYGIYSGMTPMLSQGSYAINFSTRNDKANEAIQATLAVLKDTTANGVTQHELALTQDNLVNSFPLSLSSNAGINSTLGMMGFYGLPDRYLSDYVSRVKQADLAQVNTSYRRLVHPEQFLIVTVGKQADQPANAAPKLTR